MWAFVSPKGLWNAFVIECNLCDVLYNGQLTDYLIFVSGEVVSSSVSTRTLITVKFFDRKCHKLWQTEQYVRQMLWETIEFQLKQ